MFSTFSSRLSLAIACAPLPQFIFRKIAVCPWHHNSFRMSPLSRHLLVKLEKMGLGSNGVWGSFLWICFVFVSHFLFIHGLFLNSFCGGRLQFCCILTIIHKTVKGHELHTYSLVAISLANNNAHFLTIRVF